MKIGWIGTGVMGRSMAGHVQAAGHELYVYNRTKAKAEDLLKKGATWCDSPAEVAAKSETLFSMVGLPNDVEETYLSKQGGRRSRRCRNRGSCSDRPTSITLVLSRFNSRNISIRSW